MMMFVVMKVWAMSFIFSFQLLVQSMGKPFRFTLVRLFMMIPLSVNFKLQNLISIPLSLAGNPSTVDDFCAIQNCSDALYVPVL